MNRIITDLKTEFKKPINPILFLLFSLSNPIVIYFNFLILASLQNMFFLSAGEKYVLTILGRFAMLFVGLFLFAAITFFMYGFIRNKWIYISTHIVLFIFVLNIIFRRTFGIGLLGFFEQASLGLVFKAIIYVLITGAIYSGFTFLQYRFHRNRNFTLTTFTNFWKAAKSANYPFLLFLPIQLSILFGGIPKDTLIIYLLRPILAVLLLITMILSVIIFYSQLRPTALNAKV